jgi:hypothetical protein
MAVLLQYMLSPTVRSQNLHAHWQNCFIFMTWKIPGHSASGTEFCGTSGQSTLKPIKPGLSRKNRDEWDHYVTFKMFVSKVIHKGLLTYKKIQKSRPFKMFVSKVIHKGLLTYKNIQKSRQRIKAAYSDFI